MTSSVPEAGPGSADPRQAAEEYMEHHKIPQLLEALTAELMFHKPEDPRHHIVKFLESVRLHGTPPLLNEIDLQTMFSMFDLTNRGTLTAEQANNALFSIIGPSKGLQALGVEPKAQLTKEQFVKYMSEALKAAVPYKR